jgi:UDP-GlcNAc:undecaprenyl-phosphate GlcNAc-1-phosphate transferase
VPFVIALVATALSMPAFLAIGRATGLLDRPSGDSLKIHGRPVPLTGGLGVALGLSLGVVAVTGTTGLWVLAAAGVALVVGTLDDRRPLPASIRIAAQAGAGVVLAVGGLRLEPLGPLAVAAIVVATVACANAVNLVDGQDGLAGGLAAVAAGGFALLLPGGSDARDLALALAGSLAGFLFWNRPPARVFLGNGGAYALGVVLAALASDTAKTGWSAMLAAALVLGPFAYELSSTVVRRVAGGRSLASGDRRHVYDVAADRLGARARSTAAAVAIGVASVPVAVAVADMEPEGAIVAVVVYAAVLAAVDLLLRRPPIRMREELR